ncbi:MAG: zinc ribbon domain-containing protein [Candidatus Moranbacteria bacterium]|nr:zinc ribbon domain-containing protein [Candidatus Moranbacteria bacterium]
MDNLGAKCPRCLTDNPADSNFCLKCGFQMKEIPPSSSVWKQISIYFISFFLPPFGLIPAFKYLRQSDTKLKNIGLIAIFLTFLSITISIYLGVTLFNQLNTEVNKEMQNITF